MKSRTEILVPLAAIQAVPIAVIAWYRLHRYAWYRYSAIVTEKPKYTVFVSYKRPETPASGGGMAGQTFRKIAELIMKTCK